MEKIPCSNTLNSLSHTCFTLLVSSGRIKKIRKMVIVLVLSTLVFASLGWHVYASPTVMKVDPSSSSVSPGDSFNVNVSIADVVSLAGWEFKLYFSSPVLNCSAITEGPFLKSAGQTFAILQIENTYNATHGRVLAACALIGFNSNKSGSGVLATLTFKAVGLGDSVLDLVDTKLAGPGDPAPPIPHSATDGTVHVGGTVKLGDVNGDGKVNVLDLISVASQLGWVGPPGSIPQDQTGDGRVNVLDLIFVARYLGT